MFDPTVFDNLKVAIENQVYDLDNLTGQIQVVNRIDRLELAVMGREFAIVMAQPQHPDVTAELRLEATLQDLAAELLRQPNAEPACTLTIRFHMELADPAAQCPRIEAQLVEIWQPDEPPVQTVSSVYGQEPPVYRNVAELRFGRRINEDQMEDIPDLINHVLRTLTALSAL